MVRKSERNKHGTPDKTVEKPSTRKSSRQTRRRKKSTSESEPEPEVPVEKETKKEKHEEKPETSDAHVRLRRSARTKNTPDVEVEKVVEKPKEEKPEKDKDWKEDNTFWESQPTKVEEAKVENSAGEGTTWKIQSSNGSGGEIQKLKICRQRLTDSAESSSSPTKESLSPRRKRYTKRATKGDKNDAGSAESTGSHTDSEAQLPTQVEEAQVAEVQPLANESEAGPKAEEVVPQVQEEVVQEPTPEKEEEAQVEPEPAPPTPPQTGKEEGELDTTVEISVVEQVDSVQEESPKHVKEDSPKPEEVESSQIQTEEISKPEEEVSSKPETDQAPQETSEKEDVPKTKPEEKIESEESEAPQKFALLMSNEIAMEEIAKKLNERAAAKGAKEIPEEKEKKTPTEAKSPEPPVDKDTTKEEGEISSAAPTPEPVKHKTTVIINKTETSVKPTALKRFTEETSSSQRKRRTSNKQVKPPKDSQIAISSLTLKTLVPDVAPVPLEEVKELLTIDKPDLNKVIGAERKRSHRDSSEEPGELIDDIEPERSLSPESKRRKSTEDKQAKLTERRRSTKDEDGELKEAKKKIVIKHKDDNSAKITENHKVTRKISIVSDDPKTLKKSPSPSAKKATNVLYITNLVRPFTVPQLKELLARTGTIAQNGFYIDKIKSKCFVKYTNVETAVETRQALHGVRWPINNPKTLKVEFSTDQNLNVMLRLAEEEHNAAIQQEAAAIDRTVIEKVDKELKEPAWAEKNTTKTSRRVTTSIREWDMGKMAGNENQPPNQAPLEVKKEDDWKAKEKNKNDNENRRRVHSPEKSVETPRKIKKKDTEAPAKLLDGLFRKTKATPCIYWLPLTSAQIAVKEEIRRQHVAEHERRLAQAEQRKADSRRDKGKDKDRARERERDREREKEREREREKRKK